MSSEITVNGKPIPFELTELDRQTMLLTDEEYVPDDWAAVKKIVGENRLMDFRRYPSHLKRYITWTMKTKAAYGNMTNYLCNRRLKWTPRPDATEGEHRSMFEYANSTPFADPRDWKILYNDWNYGLTSDIVHLVVWSKTPVEVKPETGEATDYSKQLIRDFVDRTIVQDMKARGKGEDCVLWFKNWTKLQSMRAVEHFHLMVRNADPDLLAKWTNGDSKDASVLEEGGDEVKLSK